MKKYLYITIGGLLFFITGCAGKINMAFNQNIKNGLQTTKNYEQSVENKFKRMQKNGDDYFIDLSVNQMLSSALKKLGYIEHRVYILKGQDIQLKQLPLYASEQLHINTFQKLQNYIESTSPYTIKIVKNLFILDAPKVVEVFNRAALKTKLGNTPFSLQGDINVKDALDLLAKETGFSVIYNGIDFKGINLYYKSGNVADFLNYLQEALNVWINIDYQNKIIILSKYNTETFNLVMPEITEDTTFNVVDNLNAAQKKENKRVSNIVSTITQLVGKDGNVIANNGTLVIKTTYQKMQEISKIIDFYNKNYLQAINIKFEIYKFLLSKNYNFGIDFNYQNGQNSLVSNFINTVIFKNNYVSANSDNNFIRFYKHYSFTSSMVNGIPQTIAIVDKKNYIKSITATTTTGTATSTQISTDVETLTEGQILDIIPKVYGNKVFLKTIFETTTLNSMDNVNEGTTTLNLPDVSQNLINPTKIFNFGDRKLVGIYQTYENVSNFKGVVPIQNFVIGGNENQQYVRELIAVVVTVTKPKN